MIALAVPRPIMVASARRWIVVVVAAIAVTWLAHDSLLIGSTPPSLGVAARAEPGRLIVQWVQPAGWAWDAGVRPGDVVVSVDDLSVTTRPTRRWYRQQHGSRCAVWTARSFTRRSPAPMFPTVTLCAGCFC